MSEEYNPEGPELDEVFEQPVQCSNCGDWHELNDSYFWTGYCECPSYKSCSHGVCKKCYKVREDE